MTEPGHRPRRPSRSLPVSVALLVLVVAVPARDQLKLDRWELKIIAGRDTIAEPARALLPPDGARLLVQIDWDRDGRDEFFAARSTPLDDARQFEHRIQVLTEGSGGLPRVTREYVFRDAELLWPSVVVPPDGRDTIKVLADVAGGSKWAVRYVLESTSETPFRMPGSSDVEFADLDGNGVYEAVTWTDRPEEPRCRFGMFSVRASSLTALAAAALPGPGVAFWMASDDHGCVTVLTASPQVCEQGGVPPETGLTYEFREGRLRPIR